MYSSWRLSHWLMYKNHYIVTMWCWAHLAMLLKAPSVEATILLFLGQLPRCITVSKRSMWENKGPLAILILREVSGSIVQIAVSLIGLQPCTASVLHDDSCSTASGQPHMTLSVMQRLSLPDCTCSAARLCKLYCHQQLIVLHTIPLYVSGNQMFPYDMRIDYIHHYYFPQFIMYLLDWGI